MSVPPLELEDPRRRWPDPALGGPDLPHRPVDSPEELGGGEGAEERERGVGDGEGLRWGPFLCAAGQRRRPERRREGGAGEPLAGSPRVARLGALGGRGHKSGPSLYSLP